MSSAKPRLRMAPSPTGFMHLGTLRSALFGYLLAKKWGGSFILRIEDTDQKRLVPGAVDSLIAVFKDLGIIFDEGPEQGGPFAPYTQTERLDIYRRYTDELIEKGEAYYCFMTSGELETLRNEQIARHEPPRYDRRFRDYPLEEAKKRIANGEPYVVRHKLPLEGSIEVFDELRGKIVFSLAELDDYVLLKSDGIPTYQLASVVDDHLMEITHVTRGQEWIPSFPKNVLLYKSLGWEAPKFIHLPLILNKTGGKLSKRQGDVFVEDYLKQGYLPEAIINFCVLLGWHPKNDQEIFSLAELEKIFDIDGMGISPAIFDDEKLKSINSHYIRNKSEQELLMLAKPFFDLDSAPDRKKTDEFLNAVLKLEKERLKVLSEIGESTKFFFEDELTYDPKLLIWKNKTADEIKNNLEDLVEWFKDAPDHRWIDKDSVEAQFRMYFMDAGKTKEQIGEYLWPMRVALSGQKASPGPFEIASVLGKTETLDKITFASRLLK